MPISVYAFTGFLESGKTKFIQETLEDERFNAGERTLLHFGAVDQSCQVFVNDRLAGFHTDGYLDFQQEAVGLLLESPAFALTWDIGHSHTANVDDVPFLLARKERIAHFHIHDATEKRCHLVLGDGELPLSDALSLAEECRARCVLETKTPEALERSVEWLRQNDWL